MPVLFDTSRHIMPIYEYACADCGHAFEALVRAGSQPECPQCHSQTLERQLSVFATSSGSPDSTPPVGPCGQVCCHATEPGACAMH